MNASQKLIDIIHDVIFDSFFTIYYSLNFRKLDVTRYYTSSVVISIDQLPTPFNPFVMNLRINIQPWIYLKIN